MGIDERTIEQIRRRILSVARPTRIILFGSAVSGPMGRDSDIDLLVVEPEGFDRREEYVRIRQSLRGLGRPFDIVLVSSAWFEASKDVVGSMAYPASRHGKVIYDAA